jgi:acyl-CoA synthetase
LNFQATPTLISRFSPELLKSTLFSASSKLKILAFGGETCPTPKTIASWRGEANITQFYNLYGITEVSSWASCYKIEACELLDEADEIFLGDPLSDTVFEVRSNQGVQLNGEGELYIGKYICSSIRSLTTETCWQGH